MTNNELQAVRKLQNTLIRIDNGERFFFNITILQNKGLIKEKNIKKLDAYGNETVIRTEWLLTEKAKQYINVCL
jgi:hypothetical protein